MTGHVFVGGLHRTGTSLVARWLAAHPAVTGFRDTGVWEDEGQHLQDVLPPARLLGGPGVFAFHPAARQGPVENDRVPALRQALLRTWLPLWGEGTWRLEKSPPNLLRSPLLAQLFPDARFVFTVRHPLAVAYATRRMARSRRQLDVVEMVRHWCVAYEQLQQDRAELQPGQSVLLPLEDLARQGSIDPAFSLLGLSPVPAPEPLRPDPNSAYRAAMVRAGSRLRPRLRTRLEALRARVSACGYSLFEDG